jgi:hypothetical protein
MTIALHYVQYFTTLTQSARLAAPAVLPLVGEKIGLGKRISEPRPRIAATHATCRRSNDYCRGLPTFIKQHPSGFYTPGQARVSSEMLQPLQASANHQDEDVPPMTDGTLPRPLLQLPLGSSGRCLLFHIELLASWRLCGCLYMHRMLSLISVGQCRA